MRRAARSDRALWLVLAIAVTSGESASLTAQAPASASIVEIRLSPSNEHYRRRIENAAKESLARLSEWLGPTAASQILITDRHATADGHVVLVTPPWRPAPSTMAVESQVAYGIARQWWVNVTEDEPARPIANGIAWYLQSRLVERLYDFAFLNPGHSSDAVRFFGGVVPWEFPLLRMNRWTAAGRMPADVDRVIGRIALTCASLERSAGWPAVQGALFEAARRSRVSPLSSEALVETIGSAMGQDASGLFEFARDRNRTIDYAVGAMSSASCPTGKCVITKVTAERAGNGSVPQGVELRVEFADGQQVEARWDGRAESKEFEFESPAPPVGVHLDPNRIVLLDANWLNNDRLVTPRTNVPIGKWVARWAVWLQDATLSYASLF